MDLDEGMELSYILNFDSNILPHKKSYVKSSIIEVLSEDNADRLESSNSSLFLEHYQSSNVKAKNMYTKMGINPRSPKLLRKDIMNDDDTRTEWNKIESSTSFKLGSLYKIQPSSYTVLRIVIKTQIWLRQHASISQRDFFKVLILFNHTSSLNNNSYEDDCETKWLRSALLSLTRVHILKGMFNFWALSLGVIENPEIKSHFRKSALTRGLKSLKFLIISHNTLGGYKGTTNYEIAYTANDDSSQLDRNIKNATISSSTGDRRKEVRQGTSGKQLRFPNTLWSPETLTSSLPNTSRAISRTITRSGSQVITPTHNFDHSFRTNQDSGLSVNDRRKKKMMLSTSQWNVTPGLSPILVAPVATATAKATGTRNKSPTFKRSTPFPLFSPAMTPAHNLSGFQSLPATSTTSNKQSPMTPPFSTYSIREATYPPPHALSPTLKLMKSWLATKNLQAKFNSQRILSSKYRYFHRVIIKLQRNKNTEKLLRLQRLVSVGFFNERRLYSTLRDHFRIYCSNKKLFRALGNRAILLYLRRGFLTFRKRCLEEIILTEVLDGNTVSLLRSHPVCMKTLYLLHCPVVIRFFRRLVAIYTNSTPSPEQIKGADQHYRCYHLHNSLWYWRNRSHVALSLRFTDLFKRLENSKLLCVLSRLRQLRKRKATVRRKAGSRLLPLPLLALRYCLQKLYSRSSRCKLFYSWYEKCCYDEIKYLNAKSTISSSSSSSSSLPFSTLTVPSLRVYSNGRDILWSHIQHRSTVMLPSVKCWLLLQRTRSTSRTSSLQLIPLTGDHGQWGGKEALASSKNGDAITTTMINTTGSPHVSVQSVRKGRKGARSGEVGVGIEGALVDMFIILSNGIVLFSVLMMKRAIMVWNTTAQSSRNIRSKGRSLLAKRRHHKIGTIFSLWKISYRSQYYWRHRASYRAITTLQLAVINRKIISAETSATDNNIRRLQLGLFFQRFLSRVQARVCYRMRNYTEGNDHKRMIRNSHPNSRNRHKSPRECIPSLAMVPTVIQMNIRMLLTQWKERTQRQSTYHLLLKKYIRESLVSKKRQYLIFWKKYSRLKVAVAVINRLQCYRMMLRWRYARLTASSRVLKKRKILYYFRNSKCCNILRRHLIRSFLAELRISWQRWIDSTNKIAFIIPILESYHKHSQLKHIMNTWKLAKISYQCFRKYCFQRVLYKLKLLVAENQIIETILKRRWFRYFSNEIRKMGASRRQLLGSYKYYCRSIIRKYFIKLTSAVLPVPPSGLYDQRGDVNNSNSYYRTTCRLTLMESLQHAVRHYDRSRCHRALIKWIKRKFIDDINRSRLMRKVFIKLLTPPFLSWLCNTQRNLWRRIKVRKLILKKFLKSFCIWKSGIARQRRVKEVSCVYDDKSRLARGLRKWRLHSLQKQRVEMLVDRAELFGKKRSTANVIFHWRSLALITV